VRIVGDLHREDGCRAEAIPAEFRRDVTAIARKDEAPLTQVKIIPCLTNATKPLRSTPGRATTLLLRDGTQACSDKGVLRPASTRITPFCAVSGATSPYVPRVCRRRRVFRREYRAVSRARQAGQPASNTNSRPTRHGGRGHTIRQGRRVAYPVGTRQQLPRRDPRPRSATMLRLSAQTSSPK
jgi:hypothetical protein